MIGFFIGLFVGCALGMVVFSLCVAASRGDEMKEDAAEKHFNQEDKSPDL